MVNKVYRGGVFGFGGMGQSFTTQININSWYGAEFRVIGVCNRGEKRRKLAEDKFGLKTFKEPRDLIKEGLDFGIVASTTVAHCEQVCLLAEAGIPIFCEKPIALTLADARQMIAAAEKTGVPTVVNFGRRMDSCNRKIKDMISKEMFGRLIAFASFVNRGHGFYSEGARHRAVVEPQESGGWIVHHACHQIDLACWLMGKVDAVSMVSRSTASDIETVPGLPSEEMVMGRLYFAGGAVGSIADCVGGVCDQHLNIVGTRCSAGIVEAGGVPLVKYKLQGDPEWGPPRIIDPRQDFPPEDNLRSFLKIVRDNGASPVTIKEAYYALKVSIAMRESAVRNGEVIKVEDMEKI